MPIAESSVDPVPAARLKPRRRWKGALVALLLLLAVAALAWWLTHRPPQAGGAGAGAGGMGGGPPGAMGGGPGGPPGGGGGGGGGRGGPPVTVGVAPVQAADVPVTLDALGTVTPLATVTVRPQVSGVLQELRFREGQRVAKGELLALIDPRPFEIALQQAVGSRQRDEAQLANAQLTLQRFQTLLQQDSIARQEVDTQAALVRQLEATVVTDRAAEASARLNLSYTRIVSPVAGLAGLRQVDAGNLVASSDAAGLVVITQTSPVDVAFAVPQDQVPALRAKAAGARLAATALDRSRSKALAEGRFWTLDNQVDVQTGTVRAKARFDNADGALFANQFVNLRLELERLQGVPTVPLAALRQGAQGEFVYAVQEDRTVKLKTVKRGPAAGERVAVLQGLKVGEQVVTEGADRLRDGARVQLPGGRREGGGRPEGGAGEGRPRGDRPPGGWREGGGPPPGFGEGRRERPASAPAP